MRSLPTLQEELRLFPLWLHHLIEIREDAISGMLFRKPDDFPFISGTNRVGSPVERIVINILSAGHVRQLERAVHAATLVFFEFPSHQALLQQFWLGKHEADLPEELLLRYQELRYPPREPEEPEAA